MLAGLGEEPSVIICGASVLLIVAHYQGATGYYQNVLGNRFDGKPYAGAVGHFWWFLVSLTLYLVMPLILSVATKGSFFRRYGFGLGDWRAGLKLTAVLLAVMLPAAWYASTLPTFKGMYPLAGSAAYQLRVDGKQINSLWLFVTYEAAYMAYFIGWEFLFRGWMVNGLLPRMGKLGAVMVQVAPFAVMHLGKAELEALGSVIAGVALGLLALRTRSFWYGALLHGLVALWMDLLSVRPDLWP